MGPEFHHWGEPDPSVGPYGPGGEFIGGGPHGPGYPPGPDHHHPGPGYPPGPPADVRETERLLIPEGVVGVVIGKGFLSGVF